MDEQNHLIIILDNPEEPSSDDDSSDSDIFIVRERVDAAPSPQATEQLLTFSRFDQIYRQFPTHPDSSGIIMEDSDDGEDSGDESEESGGGAVGGGGSSIHI